MEKRAEKISKERVAERLTEQQDTQKTVCGIDSKRSTPLKNKWSKCQMEEKEPGREQDKATHHT